MQTPNKHSCPYGGIVNGKDGHWLRCGDEGCLCMMCILDRVERMVERLVPKAIQVDPTLVDINKVTEMDELDPYISRIDERVGW